MPFRSPFLATLKERGFIHQTTQDQALDQSFMENSPVKGYLGFDVTAKSLHVGHLTTLMMAKWLQETGHEPILLMGGGTTKIGDPSGRDTTRTILSQADIQQNIQSIRPTFDRLFSEPVTLVNNEDWLDDLAYIPFLREIGVHFSVNKMLTFESVRLRLERQQPLSFIEFNYMLLQSYDFLKLYETHGCTLQFGGSDQWGNIVSGIDLVRRMKGEEVFGITCPLLTTSSGKKMGKTAQGAVWLNGDLLSPYNYWQFWRSCEDQDAVRFLKLYTMIPMEQIMPYEGKTGQDLNKAKELLADEATALVHGRNSLEAIHATRDVAFGKGVSLDTLASNHQTTRAQVPWGTSLLQACIDLGFCTSKSEGRRAVRQGSITLYRKGPQGESWQETVSDESLVLSKEVLPYGSLLGLGIGKKFGILELN